MTGTMEAPTTGPAPAEPRRHPWVKALLCVVIAAILAMWVYAFVLAPKKGVYHIDSAQWRHDAEQICKAATLQRISLADTSGGVIDKPTHADMIERADIVDRSTDILEQMLNQVVALPLSTVRDRQLVDVWEGYYRSLLNDRRQYTADLRRFNDEPFHEELVAGGPISDVLTDFTSGNGITSCAPPGELG
jgi:hypothetical protein